MSIFVILILATILYGLLVLASYKVKGNKSLFVRVSTSIFVLCFFALLIMFYGATIFQSIQLDFSSFSSIKGFVGSKVLGIIAIVLVWLFVFFKIFYVVFRFWTAVKISRKELTFVIPFVVFDIAVVPNIISLGTGAVLLAYISILTTGLACAKLVFCLFNNAKNEVVIA